MTTDKNGVDFYTLIQKNSLKKTSDTSGGSEFGFCVTVSNLGKLHNLRAFPLVIKVGAVGSPFVYLP